MTARAFQDLKVVICADTSPFTAPSLIQSQKSASVTLTCSNSTIASLKKVDMIWYRTPRQNL